MGPDLSRMTSILLKSTEMPISNERCLAEPARTVRRNAARTVRNSSRG